MCGSCKKEKRRKEEEKKQLELKIQEEKKQEDLRRLHEFLNKNLNATSPDQLNTIDCSYIDRTTLSHQANSIKNDEKIYVVCAARAKRTKYIKSQRMNFGSSCRALGLKGFRVFSSVGQSVPIYNLVEVGAGDDVLTNKNIHLSASTGQPVKIPYGKIEGFHLFNDGLQIYHGLKNPSLFFLEQVDPIQHEVIGHIIDLYQNKDESKTPASLID